MCSWALRGVVDVMDRSPLPPDGDENLSVESSDQNCSDGQAQNSKTMLQNLDAPQWHLGRFWQQERQQITLQQYTLFQDIHIVYSKEKKRAEFFSR